MISYPKIETLFDRDEQTHKVLTDRIRCPEFTLVRQWLVTEKIDGMNIRVHLVPERDGVSASVFYGGRTDAAQLPMPLVAWLQTTLNSAVVAGAFDPNTEAVLYGEGYGAGIQRGGGYRSGPGFRLFDVLVVAEDRRWWLNWSNVCDIAAKLSIPTVPRLGEGMSMDEIVRDVRTGQPSVVATHDGGSGCAMEGIVARTDPILLMRDGVHRLVWKLKSRDF